MNEGPCQHLWSCLAHWEYTGADYPDSVRSASLSIVDSNLLTRSNNTVVSGIVVGDDRMACTARAGAWTGVVSASRIANILRMCCSASSRLAGAAVRTWMQSSRLSKPIRNFLGHPVVRPCISSVPLAGISNCTIYGLSVTCHNLNVQYQKLIFCLQLGNILKTFKLELIDTFIPITYPSY